MHFARPALPLLLLASLAACTDPVSSAPKAGLGATSVRSQISTPADPNSHATTLDGLFLQIASRAPSFAGFYYAPGGSGRIVVRLVNLTERPAAESAIREHLQGTPDAGASMDFVAASFPMTALDRWRRQVEAILDKAGAEYTSDVDEVLNQVAFGAFDATTASALRNAAAHTGAPEGAIRIDMVERPRMQSTLDDRFRPLMAGTMTWQWLPADGLYTDCTMGPLVQWYYSGIGTTARGFITNSHCTNAARQVGGNNNAVFYQGGMGVSGDYIGTETRDPDFTNPGNNPDCASNVVCRYADAAFVQVDPATVSMSNFRIAKTSFYTAADTGSKIVVDSLTITAELGNIELYSGAAIHKIGRRSGWTWGTITQTCQTYSMGFNAAGVEKKLLCQYITNGSSEPGDSGSPVFIYWSDGTARLAGILWGGESVRTTGGRNMVFSPVNGIWRDLRSAPGELAQFH